MEVMAFSFIGVWCVAGALGLLIYMVQKHLQLEKYSAFFRLVCRLGEKEEVKESLYERVWKDFKLEYPSPMGLFLSTATGIFIGRSLELSLCDRSCLVIITTMALFLVQHGATLLHKLLKLVDEPYVKGIEIVTNALTNCEKLSLPSDPVITPNPNVEERILSQWTMLEKYLSDHSTKQHITISLNDIDSNNPLFEQNKKLLAERRFFPHRDHCRQSGCKGEICLILDKEPVECVLF